ncbi:TraR/DksA family transcriptional regulator [Salinisphaera hydrothermalis]|uniref:DnaK suppressor protein n=1 Tax=Salinisphaera hydrothermalis (strain C41B8) TaxID=1304275 RepID=A0A084IGW4_SALHC|nr:TraR/DksA C4-type zinc finger protein [Salinisphaera hydrothermalis]KEZ75948.1 dnaK suppressor protein [Salinisphaera hydrothermalis C41B8]
MNHPELDDETVRATLQALRQQSRDESQRSQSQRATVELDQTTTGRLSRMDALQSQAMAQATERRRAIQLQRIEQALKRLDEGGYGECIVCGEWIGKGRLELDPAALKCIECAE